MSSSSSSSSIITKSSSSSSSFSSRSESTPSSESLSSKSSSSTESSSVLTRSSSSSSVETRSSSSSSSWGSSSSSSEVSGVDFGAADSAYTSPSLTLKIINQEALASEVISDVTDTAVEKIARGRLRGNMASTAAIWGFEDLHIDSKVANGVVLCGETVGIYIEPLGDGVGYLKGSDKLVFSNTQIELNLIDTYFGIIKTATFSDFALDEDDVGRYVTWTVPEADSARQSLYSSKGYHGAWVLEVKVTESLYGDAAYETPIKVNGNVITNVNTSYLNIYSVWAKQILQDVTISTVANSDVLDDIDGITGSVSILDGKTLAEIFDDETNYPNYLHAVGATTFDLSSSEKEVIIRDLAMALLSTQAPILTLDAFNAPLIGIGITNGAPSEGTLDKLGERKWGFYEFQSQVSSRLFGLNGTYLEYNFHDTLKNWVDNNSQLSFSALNPVKLGSVNNELALGLGHTDESTVHGVAYAIDSAPVSLTLSNDTEFITDLSLTQGSLNLSFASEGVVDGLTFGMNSGDRNYRRFFEESGKIRSVSMDDIYFDATENINYGQITGRKSENYDLVHRKIEVPEIGSGDGPLITDVVVRQREDNSGIIDVFYNYYSYDFVPSTITVLYSDNGGSSYSSMTSSYGDTGAGVVPGLRRRITWKAGDDLSGSSQVVVKITATNAYEDTGEATGAGEYVSQPNVLIQTKPEEVAPFAVFESNYTKFHGFDVETLSYLFWSSSSSINSSSSSLNSSSSTPLSQPINSLESETSYSSGVVSSDIESELSSESIMRGCRIVWKCGYDCETKRFYGPWVHSTTTCDAITPEQLSGSGWLGVSDDWIFDKGGFDVAFVAWQSFEHSCYDADPNDVAETVEYGVPEFELESISLSTSEDSVSSQSQPSYEISSDSSAHFDDPCFIIYADAYPRPLPSYEDLPEGACDSSQSSSSQSTISSSSQSEEVNPCSGDDPEMLLTVSGASGTINWCGETWNLPDDSGDQRSVCPDSYYRSKGHNPTGTGWYPPYVNERFFAREYWNKGVGTERLNLHRGYEIFRNTMTPSLWQLSWYPTFNINALYVAGDYDEALFYSPPGTVRPKDGTGWANEFVAGNLINKVIGIDSPLYSPDSRYRLSDDFFGDHTISGINYAWEKGAGW